MNFKEYVETKYNLNLDEPFSYYNVQWMSWAEEYAEYKQYTKEFKSSGGYTGLNSGSYYAPNIPRGIDPVKALEYGKCNFCGKWYGECKGH